VRIACKGVKIQLTDALKVLTAKNSVYSYDFCISAFLWVKEEKRTVNKLCLSGDVSTKEILVNSKDT
jgi:hypothetical protein